MKSIVEPTIGSVLKVPSVHCPPASSPSNKVNKSNADGKPDSQNDAGLSADGVPEVKLSKTVIVTVDVPSRQVPFVGTVYVNT